MRVARPIVTATTMLSVVAMAFVTSVPANAVLNGDDLVSVQTTGSVTAKAQRLAETSAAAAAISRDNYTATSAPKITVTTPTGPVAVAMSTAEAVRWPFDGELRLSDDFGPRVSPCSGCSSMHPGTDFLPGEGNPVYSIADGVVTQVVSSDVGLGVHVVIEHLVDGQVITSTYAHLQFGSLTVVQGQKVPIGTQIGRVGNTGASTGPHLHFELRPGGGDPIDPYAWLSARVG
ncbi:M23 family metallopeptidase [Naasia sp. SYSU D00948]|uniref:M23 family metallopeptidase n=1 Tax=Naasia sp. SYSU D00948 TaxID=2817379 RepID=UPI001B304213|nr:M23 family metallopeptidase [Naasia sp. SYSU D00948]